jgi:hypothetical protein
MGRWATIYAVLMLSTPAYAGAWYYKWSCAGQCAPNQLAISGVSAGYPTEELCNDARWGDPNRTYFLESGNLGSLTSCEEYESAPAPDANAADQSAAKFVFQRSSIGAVAGSGYRVGDATTDSTGSSTLGASFNIVTGGRPWIGLEFGFGVQFSSVLAPHFGTTAKTLTYLPVTMGFTSSPAIVRARKVEVRLDLGADAVGLFELGCDTCEADDLDTVALLGELRAGLDFYFGNAKSKGVAINASMMFGRQGNIDDEFLPSAIEITPPRYLLRAAYIGRNMDLFW